LLFSRRFFLPRPLACIMPAAGHGRQAGQGGQAGE
jgi:hypothetical protein